MSDKKSKPDLLRTIRQFGRGLTSGVSDYTTAGIFTVANEISKALRNEDSSLSVKDSYKLALEAVRDLRDTDREQVGRRMHQI